MSVGKKTVNSFIHMTVSVGFNCLLSAVGTGRNPVVIVS